MALPPGIVPKTVTVGIASFFDGTLAEGTATITAPVNVVHTPTNRPIFSSQMSKRFVDGEASFNLTPTDAPGLNRVDWTYKLNVVISGGLLQPDPIYFTLPAAGPDIIDLDALVPVPSSAGIPVSVAVLTAEDLPDYMASVAADQDSAFALAQRATYARRDGIDLRDWVDYDATGNNSMISVLNAAMAQATDGDVIRVPKGLFALDDEWVVSKNVDIIGAGIHDVYPGVNTAITFDNPTVAPYLTGSVFLQTTAAKNGLSITKSAWSGQLRGFGVRFADSIRFTNTGHGISGVATATYNGGHDHGLVAFKVADVRVFGHDGNHYGLHMVNPLHGSINDFRSYGGGGMHVECDSFAGNYGNLVVSHPFAHLFCPGTANGYNLRGRVASGTSGVLNLMTFVRPQCNSTDQTTRYSKAATSAQYLFRASQPASTNALTVLNPDFETTVNSPVDFGGGSNFIDPAGIFGASSDTASRSFRVFRSTAGAKGLNSDMTFSNVNTPGPTVAAGAGLGTGGTASISAGGDDLVGSVDFVAGTASTAAFQPLFTVTWGRLTAATAVMLTPRNGSTAPLNLYVSNVTGTGFTVNAAVAPTASATYKVSFLVTR